MREFIFTMKGTGNELPAKWTGVTVPVTLPDFDDALDGVRKYSGAKNAYTLWARAERLDAQKEVKAYIQKHPDASVDEVRAFAAKRGERLRNAELKLRDPNAEPKSKSSGEIKAAKAKSSLLDRLLAAHPELAAQYAPELAAIPTAEPKVATAPSAPAPAAAAGGKKNGK